MVRRAKRAMQVLACVAGIVGVLATAAWAQKGKPGGGGSPPPPVGFRYQKWDLGTLGGTWSVASNMNNVGDVVGLSARVDGAGVPFVYIAATGTMHSVNSLIERELDYPAELVFGPDRNGDGHSDLHVVNRGHSNDGAGSVSLFDGVDGSFLGHFIPPGSGGLTQPAVLCIGPDGDFYLPSSTSGTTAPRNRVLRFDGATGAPLGEFVGAGSGGLTRVHSVAFGSDVDGDQASDLFLTSDDTIFAVLAYSGVDGEFIGVFVAPGSGGLERPSDLVFVPDRNGDGTPDLLVNSNSFDGTGEAVVLAFSGADGAFIEEVTPRMDNNFVSVAQLVVGPDGALYLNDSLGDQVLRYDPATELISVFVPNGHGGLGTGTPFVTFDPEGDVYVSNESQQEILKYDEAGAFIGAFVRSSAWILDTADDINDAGQIAGTGRARGAAGDFTSGGYLLNPPAGGALFGTVVDLGAPVGAQVGVAAINENGDVVGSFTDPNAGFHAFLFTPEDGFVDLGMYNGIDNFANDISDRNAAGVVTIVGGSEDYKAWKATCTPGALGGGVTLRSVGALYSDRRSPGRSGASGVNNAGQLVGWTTINRDLDVRAARHTDAGGWVNLGTLAPTNSNSWTASNDSDAGAINDAGYTIGVSRIGDSSAVPSESAFIHHDTFGMRNLTLLVDGLAAGDAAVLGRPVAITSGKLICGPSQWGFGALQTKRAYVLVPYPVP